MRKVVWSLILVAGILAAPSAMAVHTCGQMLGSCLPHIDPIVLPPKEPVTPVEEAIKPVERVQPAPRVETQKCFKQSGSGVLVQIPCP